MAGVIIEDERFVVLANADPPAPLAEPTYALKDAELFAARPDPDAGLFVATCGDFATGSDAPSERFMGATIAGRSLRAALVRSGMLRRWYVACPNDDLVELDRRPDDIAREHAVAMPMYWRIAADEAVALAHKGLIHALVSTAFDNPQNLLFRATTRLAVPAIAYVHSIPDLSAELLHLLAGQTFAFDALIAPSQAGKRALEAHFGRIEASLAVKPYAGEILVIPHGVEARPLPDRPAARGDLGWADDQEVLLALGRFERDYKADLAPLLSVFARVARQRPHARLVLAGADDGVYALQLDALAAELGIGERVELRPNVSDETKGRLLAAADALVAIADNVQETHGLSVIEAMFAGLPVVAAAWDGYNETVVHDQTGWLIDSAWHPPSADTLATASLWLGPGRPLPLQAQHVGLDNGRLEHALGQILGDRALARRFGDAGRAHAEASFDATKNGRRAAAAISERSRAARASELTWRPHLGADWLAVYGHYASAAPAPALTAAPAVGEALGERRFGQVDRASRKRVAKMLARLVEIADGRSREAIAAQLEADFPMVRREAIERWIARALKHDLLRRVP